MKTANKPVYGSIAVYIKYCAVCLKIDYSLRYLKYICLVSSQLRDLRVWAHVLLLEQTRSEQRIKAVLEWGIFTSFFYFYWYVNNYTYSQRVTLYTYRYQRFVEY